MKEIRSIWRNAALALMLACAWVAASAARQATGEPASTAKTGSKTASSKKNAPPKKSGTQSAGKKTGASASHRAGSHVSTSQAKSSTTAAKRSGSRKRKKTARGQQKIDGERAQAIQEALIREHYLSGEASGKWSQASEDAMRRYQGDHGWQTKTVPDSRALISLGLGPSKDHLLNPESAMTTLPDKPQSTTPAPTSHAGSPKSAGLAPTNSNTDAPLVPAKAPGDSAPAAQSDHSDSSSPQ